MPSTRPAGQPIYQQEPTAGELAERISIAHTPFHDALDVAVERAKRSSDSVLLLDLHSFGEPLVADVIVGDRHGQSASTPAVDIVVDCLEAVGLSTRRNERFSGGWIVQRFIGDAQVDAIQIELNQRTYLKSDAVEQFLPRPPKDPVRWAHTYQRLQDAFARLIPGYCSS